MPDDGDPWAPKSLLTPEQKKKHQLNPGGPGNRQEAPAPTNLNEKLYVGAIIESDARPTETVIRQPLIRLC